MCQFPVVTSSRRTGGYCGRTEKTKVGLKHGCILTSAPNAPFCALGARRGRKTDFFFRSFVLGPKRGQIRPYVIKQKRRAVAVLVGTDGGPEALRRPWEAPQAPKVARNGDRCIASCRLCDHLRRLKLCNMTQTYMFHHPL